MKSLRPLLIILAIIGLIVTLFLTLAEKQNMVTIFEGNIAQKAIPLKLNHYKDEDCGMVIDELNYASQVVSADGKTWFFHDHGGMVKWLEARSFKDQAVIWVYALDSKEWIDGRKAFYTRDEETPMLYGFGAYENSAKDRISFTEMQQFTLRGETMINPSIRQQLLAKKGTVTKETDGNH
jgi:nitrous oxide reductase accessory protein NosL